MTMQPYPAPPNPHVVQQNLEHLRVLSIFYYVMAAIMGLSSLLPVFHVAMGIAVVAGGFPSAPSGPGAGPPAAFGWFFIAIGATIIILGETFAICTFLAGRYLATRRAYMFCLVIAALNCMHMPLGTALGVFTIVVLLRPGVKQLFEPSVPGGP